MVKVLGIYFDTQINWIPHIKYLKTDINQRLNIIKMLKHTQLVGEEQTLIRIHRQFIKSKVDYGSTIYQSVSESYIKILNSELNFSIRL